MLNRSALALRLNARLFYGWPMLAIGFAALLGSGPGQSFVIGLFFAPIGAELGISRTMLSLVYGLGTALAALGLSYVGRLVDRHGPRHMLAAIAFLLGVVCLLMPLVNGVLQLFVAFTALRFLGQGSLTLTAVNLVSQWFSRRRGLALSVTALGFALALAVYPAVLQRVIAAQGWRPAWLWLGLWVWVLLIPAVLALVIDRPDELGLRPDGERANPERTDPEQAGPAEPGHSASQSPGGREEPEASWSAREALRTGTFWLLAVALAVPSALLTGMYVFHVPYFVELGLSPRFAADLFTVTSLSMVVSMLTYGLLLDRAPTRYVVASGIVLNGLALVAMYYAASPPVALLYAVLLGAASGAMMTNASYVWPRYFGRRHLGSIQGVAQTGAIIGASAGALPFGVAYDLLGGYRPAVALLAVLPFLFGAVVALLKPPVHPPTA
jgi:MFS family permease